MNDLKTVIVITGPTATGKTALSVEVCRRLGGEVVSADSMQLYRGMDIGTAKVTPGEAQGIPHHMIDVAGPGESFSVSRWTDMAARCCEDIFSRGRVPVIAGGTGLYIDSLLSGREFAEGPGDTGLREELSAQYDELGGEEMLERLRAFDPERAARLHPADKKRILRAIEVYELTGRTITEHDRETQALPPRYASLRFALSWRGRERLYARIDSRVDEMVSRGLFDEVRALMGSGVPDSCTAMQAIGYKEAAEALRGLCSREEAVERIKLASRRYAKRQLTWLRRDKELEWVLWDEKPDLDAAAEHIAERYREALSR